LYGTHGRTNWSLLGKPGTPEAERIRFDGGVWRYHPLRQIWEPYADGTTNPWGIDWDDWGQAFVSNCVNPHLFHVIEGAHYEPWRGRDSSQHAYERVETIADHLHYVGSSHTAGLGTNAVLEAGGGHAHCGMLVYLGGSWPERYRNTVFMNNIHGRRINNDLPVPIGSGYRASHGEDFMISRDPWFVGVSLRQAPDGGVYVSDWSDTGECHSTTNTRRETGRIYKISWGASSAPPLDLAALATPELVELQLERNDWLVRHARRLLHERAGTGADLAQANVRLRALLEREKEVPRRLRCLWALHVIGGLDDPSLLALLEDKSEHLRAWAVRLLCEDRDPPAPALARFRELAAAGDSPVVRLSLACALQRLSPADRWPIAAALATRATDADDANLPLLLWYAIEPLVQTNPERALALAAEAHLATLPEYVARRLVYGADPAPALEAISRLLAEGATDAPLAARLLVGTLAGLEGHRRLSAPRSWSVIAKRLLAHPEAAVREPAIRLALIFEDPAALAYLRKLATDSQAPADQRSEALEALAATGTDGLSALLLELISEPAIRRPALRALAAYDAPATASRILDIYPDFDAAARRDAVQTLASRLPWARDLLRAVDDGRVPRADLSAYTARQLRNLGNVELSARIRKIWGDTRETPEEKRELIDSLKNNLGPARLAEASLPNGRLLFERTCAACHKFFGEGGDLGPELTGSQRANLDYLLTNIVDPSASVSRDFQMQIVRTKAGRIATGFVAAETETALTLAMMNESLVIPLDEIETRKKSKVSIMPEGLLQLLAPDEVRDLVAYLANPHQVPRPGN
ncbi:MAG: PVC-type heme-binding CxxCH protein, partial [Verrucomicrobiales bacterium]